MTVALLIGRLRGLSLPTSDPTVSNLRGGINERRRVRNRLFKFKLLTI